MASSKPPNERELLQQLVNITGDGFAMVDTHLHEICHKLDISNAHLAVIESLLAEAPEEKQGHFNWHVQTIKRAQTGGTPMPLEVTCSVTEAFRVQVKPTTASGKPAKIESGSLKVTADDPLGPGIGATQVKIESDDTFLVAANLVDGAVSGSTTFTVEGDADLGTGRVGLADTLTLNVTSEMAQNLGLTSGGAVSRDTVGMPK